MSSSEDESTLKFKHLKKDQDKESNCPRLPVTERDIERWYPYRFYANEYISYLDYTYCVNETRLPVLRTLFSNRTLFRVSFYTETRVVYKEGEYSYKYRLTERPRNCFKYSYSLSRGTFPIDHLVYHKLEIPAKIYKRRAYTKNDPRYFAKGPTYDEWNEKTNRSPTLSTVTYQEQITLKGESYEALEFNEALNTQWNYGNYPFTHTYEEFEGHIRTVKKQRTVLDIEESIDRFKIQRAVIKRAPKWIFDSAFDTTLNPFLHVGIYYFLISEWSERK
jgi:hypothetical protein